MSNNSPDQAFSSLQKFVTRVALNGAGPNTKEHGAVLADKALAAGVPKPMIMAVMSRLQKHL